MRNVVAIALCCFGCDEQSPTTATPAPAASAVTVVLEHSSGLPRFEIQATFGANVDPKPHIQPIAAALASARTVCNVKPSSVTAVLDVDVKGKQVHASSRNSTGTCLAKEIDGKRIDDPVNYSVELLVSAS